MYASAMVQDLSTGEIIVSNSDIYFSSIRNTGYIYNIDVSYNDELKLKTKKYPSFPEKTKANVEQFSHYQKANEKKG